MALHDPFNPSLSTSTKRQLLGRTTSSQNATVPFTRGLDGTSQSGNYFFINALIVFFCVLCALALGVRLYKMLTNHMRHLFSTGPGRDQQTYFTHDQSSIWPWIKRYLLFAPLLKNRHNKEIQISAVVSIGTLPSRFHFLLLFVYFCSNLAYCSILNYHQPKAAIIAELRGRSGALAVINMIPTILLALRNNPLIPLLQVSYDTFNLLHRWAARIVLLETFVHVIAWMVNEIDAGATSGLWEHLTHDLFLGWGTIGAVAFFVMSFAAWSPIRHAFYETFLNTHRPLAGLAVAGVWIHLDVADLPQLPYVKVALAFWAIEYFLRLGRILFYNWSRKYTTRIRVEALPSDACRLTFDLVRQWYFRPGCHVHAYIPSISLWSSHPFSVAWTQDRTNGILDEKLPRHELDLDAQQNATRTSISLVVRARTGMTRKLFKKASAAPGGVIDLRGFIEGPYGGHEKLDSYGTVLLFAAGVGITHQIGYIRHLVQGYDDGTVATRKIILVWSVPNTEALEWVRPWMDEILRMRGRRDVLTIRLFVTKPKSQQEVISGTGTVQMVPGRCSPQAILDREFLDRVGAMCVTVCGPGAFADSVRSAVRRRVQLGAIDFVEEAFTY